MDPITQKRTKAILMKDYLASGKSLGEFALDWMEVYDDVCYELRLLDATSKGQRVNGTAVLGSCEGVEKFIENYEISGSYTIDLIDTQREFFMILEEIRQDLELEVNPNKGFEPALKELELGFRDNRSLF